MTEAIEDAQRLAERFEPWEDATGRDLYEAVDDIAAAKQAAADRFDEVVNEHRDYYEMEDRWIQALLRDKLDDVYVETWRVLHIYNRPEEGAYDHLNQPISLTNRTVQARAGGTWYVAWALRVVDRDD